MAFIFITFVVIVYFRFANAAQPFFILTLYKVVDRLQCGWLLGMLEVARSNGGLLSWSNRIFYEAKEAVL
jgi:hypothetical protein